MAQIHLACCSGPGGFKRHVALKCLHPNLVDDPTFVRMFMEEARLAAQLQHQNIGQVFDVGADGGTHYLAMEYLHGQNLRSLMQAAGGPLPIPLVLHIVMEVLSALHHAHERIGLDRQPLNIVHRDVSPSNVMLTYDGAVKLVDFGIARAAFRVADTRVSDLKGKIPYMSPEQAQGMPLDRRSDVFSCGILLYEATTGRRPFGGGRESDGEILRRIKHGSFSLPSSFQHSYPALLEEILLRALAIDPDRRYQSAREMYSDLDAFARSLQVPPSSRQLELFMTGQFGRPPEPWLAHSSPVDVVSATPGTISHTGQLSEAERDELAHDETLPVLSKEDLARMGFVRPASLPLSPPALSRVDARSSSAEVAEPARPVPMRPSLMRPPSLPTAAPSLQHPDAPQASTPSWAVVAALIAIAMVLGGIGWVSFVIS